LQRSIVNIRHAFSPLAALVLIALTGCQEITGGDSKEGSGAAALLPVGACADLSDADKVAREMIEAINAERTRRNLKPLRTAPALMQVADFYACRLVDGRFFDHEDPFDGSNVATRAADFGYAFFQVGENLAAEQGSVAEAMSALMKSPRHRANILDPVYTEVGIAVKTGGEHGVYWVQEFGRPITDELPAEFDAGGGENSSSQPSSRPSSRESETREMAPTSRQTR